MFSPITPQRPSLALNIAGKNNNSQRSKCYLTMAVGTALACFTLQANAANGTQSYEELPVESIAFEYDTDEAAKVVNKRVVNPNAAAQSDKVISKEFVAEQARLFYECTQVQTSGARLACFDKVAEQGKTPSYTTTKQPVDLAKTLQSTLAGNPQVVLVEENTTISANSNNTANNEAGNGESLDTVGLTQREAEVLENVGVTQADIEKYTPLSLAYDLDKNSERGTWTVRPHRPTYLLPLFYTFDPNLGPSTPSQDKEEFTSNDTRNTELKFQLSLKTKVMEDLFDTSADLWFGYTQESHWQVYNEDNSRPFRATDYQPEIFLTQPVTADLPFGGRLRMLGAGAIHHSNGQDDP